MLGGTLLLHIQLQISVLDRDDSDSFLYPKDGLLLPLFSNQTTESVVLDAEKESKIMFSISASSLSQLRNNLFQIMHSLLECLDQIMNICSTVAFG